MTATGAFPHCTKVKTIAYELKEGGLRPWVDYERLVPGRRCIPALEEVIGGIPCAAVFIGTKGWRPWDEVEVEGMLIEMIEPDVPVMRVLLPVRAGRRQTATLLKTLTRLNMRGWRTGGQSGGWNGW